MKKGFKIVRRLNDLVIVVVVMVLLTSCGQNVEGVGNEVETVETGGGASETNNKATVSTDADGNVIAEGTKTEKGTEASETEPEKVGKIEVYQALDFKTVSDCEAAYEELAEKREDYNQAMKIVVSTRMLHSDEEVATAIYNVVNIDYDMSSLLVKLYQQKSEETKNQIYLADQIESLQSVLDKMETLTKQMEESRSVYEDALKHISEADAEKIERGYKFSVNPLKKPSTQLKSKISALKQELEAALAVQ